MRSLSRFFKGMFKPNVEKLKETRDIAGLIKALKHKDHDVHQKAAIALGDFGAEPGVVPALIEVLEHRDLQVRKDSKRLIGFSVSEHYDLREAAAFALAKIVSAAKDTVLTLPRFLGTLKRVRLSVILAPSTCCNRRRRQRKHSYPN